MSNSPDPLALPERFWFRPYVGGDPALMLGDRMVAHMATLENGYARIGLCEGTLKLHYEFVPAERAQRYMAAWARKWQAQIRPLYDQPASSFWYPGSPQRP